MTLAENLLFLCFVIGLVFFAVAVMIWGDPKPGDDSGPFPPTEPWDSTTHDDHYDVF